MGQDPGSCGPRICPTSINRLARAVPDNSRHELTPAAHPFAPCVDSTTRSPAGRPPSCRQIHLSGHLPGPLARPKVALGHPKRTQGIASRRFENTTILAMQAHHHDCYSFDDPFIDLAEEGDQAAMVFPHLLTQLRLPVGLGGASPSAKRSRGHDQAHEPPLASAHPHSHRILPTSPPAGAGGFRPLAAHKMWVSAAAISGAGMALAGGLRQSATP